MRGRDGLIGISSFCNASGSHVANTAGPLDNRTEDAQGELRIAVEIHSGILVLAAGGPTPEVAEPSTM
jgi:hypothetical protein